MKCYILIEHSYCSLVADRRSKLFTVTYCQVSIMSRMWSGNDTVLESYYWYEAILVDSTEKLCYQIIHVTDDGANWVLFNPRRSTIYQKDKMKLLKSTLIAASIAQARDARSGTTCDLRQLKLFDMTNFDHWDCDDGHGDNMPKGTKCYPVCEFGYEEYCSKCYFLQLILIC